MDYIIDEKIVKNATMLTLEEQYEKALIGAAFVLDTNDGVAMVNTYYKQLYLMNVLAVDYLHLIDIGKNTLISEEEYNDLMASDIWGQVADKAKAIAESYNIFKSMFADEINNEKLHQNDVFIRLEEQLKINTTPEMIEKIEQQKSELMDKLNQLGKSAE